ncbi:hypothetical protein GCM10009606_05350 [Nocardioides aquiterrae]|uniref:Lipoprotein n=1 Tax=Nocardioides aquiterrae TaxID=203799 RepID=A0ABP4ES46_9ACTN
MGGAVAATLGLALAATACSGGGSDDPGDAGPTGPAQATDHPVTTRVTFGKVTGTLAPQVRDRLAQQVGQVVTRWTEAAYLGGDYPRRDFSDSWPGFTAGAQREAHGDRALMSNEDIGDRIDGVVPHRSVVRLDVLAVKKHPVGITAHVFLGFGTTGDLEKEVRVKGRLFLTPTDGGWKVFGYDMTKGAV